MKNIFNRRNLGYIILIALLIFALIMAVLTPANKTTTNTNTVSNTSISNSTVSDSTKYPHTEEIVNIFTVKINEEEIPIDVTRKEHYRVLFGNNDFHPTAVVKYGRQLWSYTKATGEWNLIADQIVDTLEPTAYLESPTILPFDSCRYLTLNSEGSFNEWHLDYATGEVTFIGKRSTTYYMEDLEVFASNEDVEDVFDISEEEFIALQNICREADNIGETPDLRKALLSGSWLYYFETGGHLEVHLPYPDCKRCLWTSHRAYSVNRPHSVNFTEGEWLVEEEKFCFYNYGSVIKTYSTELQKPHILLADTENLIVLSDNYLYQVGGSGVKTISKIVQDYNTSYGFVYWLSEGIVYKVDISGEIQEIDGGIISIHNYDGIIHLVVPDGDARADCHAFGWDSIAYFD